MGLVLGYELLNRQVEAGSGRRSTLGELHKHSKSGRPTSLAHKILLGHAVALLASSASRFKPSKHRLTNAESKI